MDAADEGAILVETTAAVLQEHTGRCGIDDAPWVILLETCQQALPRREPVDLVQARAVFVMDVAYVIASFALVAAWPQLLSPLGRLGVALMADVVAVFALFELVGLRRASRGAAAHA